MVFVLYLVTEISNNVSQWAKSFKKVDGFLVVLGGSTSLVTIQVDPPKTTNQYQQSKNSQYKIVDGFLKKLQINRNFSSVSGKFVTLKQQ
jgi:hypothetical protein